MFWKRFAFSAGLTALLVAALVFAFTSAPTSASNGKGTNSATTIQNAPPAQNPTMAPQTSVFDGFPPIDLGALNDPQTPAPTNAPEGVTNLVLENDFSECNVIEDEFIKVECKNGQMNFTRKDTDGTRWIYYRPELTDAVIEVSARLPNANKNARYGVVFRLDENGDNFYIFGVSNDGKYGLFRFAEDHYETIVPYTDSLYVGNAGFPTKIKLVNQGDTIAINLGGSWVDSIRDPNLKGGKVALFFEPDEPNQTVLFDDLKISEILSPVQVPEPRVIQPQVTPTTSTSTSGPAPTQASSGPAPTQTPFIIVVTATPLPATAVPTRAPTRVPTKAANACAAPPNEAFYYISNNYPGTTMRFTIGGGDWGTHDYDVPGDGKYYLIRMPPGKYTYSAFIPGKGKASGEKTEYFGGQCYSIQFTP